MIWANTGKLKMTEAETIERCARAAEAAKLPSGYQWGRDAMEQFEFGKKRAAEAIRALSATTQ